MTIHLPEDLERFIHAKVRSGQFASEDAALAEAVRLLRQRDQEQDTEKKRVEALLVEGLDSGPSTPMTSRDWDEIEREGQRIIAAQQLENLRQLGRKLDAMPSAAVADGLTNRDHDRILYGQ